MNATEPTAYTCNIKRNTLIIINTFSFFLASSSASLLACDFDGGLSGVCTRSSAGTVVLFDLNFSASLSPPTNHCSSLFISLIWCVECKEKVNGFNNIKECLIFITSDPHRLANNHFSRIYKPRSNHVYLRYTGIYLLLNYSRLSHCHLSTLFGIHNFFVLLLSRTQLFFKSLVCESCVCPENDAKARRTLSRTLTIINNQPEAMFCAIYFFFITLL